MSSYCIPVLWKQTAPSQQPYKGSLHFQMWLNTVPEVITQEQQGRKMKEACLTSKAMLLTTVRYFSSSIYSTDHGIKCPLHKF